MPIDVDGTDYNHYEIVIINDAPHLSIDLGPVSPPVINGVPFDDYEIHVLNDRATLIVPVGGPLAPLAADPTDDRRSYSGEPTQTPYTPDFDPFDEMDARLDRLIDAIEERLPPRPLAPVIDINLYRSSTRSPRIRPLVP